MLCRNFELIPIKIGFFLQILKITVPATKCSNEFECFAMNDWFSSSGDFPPSVSRGIQSLMTVRTGSDNSGLSLSTKRYKRLEINNQRF